MALLDTQIVKVEIPQSYPADGTASAFVAAKAFEQYEWLLEWYSRTGAPVYYMFYDWEGSNAVETTPINIATDDIKSLINSEDRNLTLVAEDIERVNLVAFQSLQVSKNVARITKDGERERVAIRSSLITWVNSKQRYRIQLDIQRRQPDLIV